MEIDTRLEIDSNYIKEEFYDISTLLYKYNNGVIKQHELESVISIYRNIDNLTEEDIKLLNVDITARDIYYEWNNFSSLAECIFNIDKELFYKLDELGYIDSKVSILKKELYIYINDKNEENFLRIKSRINKYYSNYDSINIPEFYSYLLLADLENDYIEKINSIPKFVNKILDNIYKLDFKKEIYDSIKSKYHLLSYALLIDEEFLFDDNIYELVISNPIFKHIKDRLFNDIPNESRKLFLAFLEKDYEKASEVIANIKSIPNLTDIVHSNFVYYEKNEIFNRYYTFLKELNLGVIINNSNLINNILLVTGTKIQQFNKKLISNIIQDLDINKDKYEELDIYSIYNYIKNLYLNIGYKYFSQEENEFLLSLIIKNNMFSFLAFDSNNLDLYKSVIKNIKEPLDLKHMMNYQEKNNIELYINGLINVIKIFNDNSQLNNHIILIEHLLEITNVKLDKSFKDKLISIVKDIKSTKIKYELLKYLKKV